jgi:hypothetical protein
VFRRTQDPLGRSGLFSYRAVTSYRGPFQVASLKSGFCNSTMSVLQPQEASLLVWAVPVSLAATQGIAFAFCSSRYLDVSVPWVCLLVCYEFTHGSRPITGGGFPHSEISGSMLTYSSPEHIGVSAVLLRLLVPRHPPCALSNLTIRKSTDKSVSSLVLLVFVVSMSSYPVFKEQVRFHAKKKKTIGGA